MDYERNSNEALFDLLEKVKESGFAANPETLDDLIERFNIYHTELTYQNEELKRINHETALENKYYRALFDRAPTPYMLIDLDGNIITVNQTFCAETGFEKYALINKNLARFLTPDSQDNCHKYLYALSGDSAVPPMTELAFNGPNNNLPYLLISNFYRENDLLFVRILLFPLRDSIHV